MACCKNEQLSGTDSGKDNCFPFSINNFQEELAERK
jgi:hypothetical protein